MKATKSLVFAAGLAGAAAAVTTQTASADSNQQTYTVKKGDTLSQLAEKFKTTIAQLASDNHIKDINKIFTGQNLVIGTPKQSNNNNTAPAPAAPAAQPQQQAPVENQSVTYAGMSIDNTAVDADNDSALQAIIMRESSGNVNAANGIYYGLGQLSPQARARYGGSTTDYNEQLQAMKAYIADRYGTASNALQHHNAYGWY